MPTAAELDRLQALVTRLTPLTEVGPGELIRAQDWNVVVGALIEVARAALAAEREGVEPPPHQHPDQVAIGWLAPGLRDLLERGPLADPAAVGRLGDLERRLGRLSEVADRLGEELSGMRASVTEVSTRDLAREAAVTHIRRVVDGIGDARDDVLSLRQTLRSLEDSVKVAVDVSSRLTIGGEPVDMEEVGARLAVVEEVRDRLQLPDGNLLDATGFEQRLADLRATLVTEAELDEALKIRSGKLDPDQVAALEEGLRAALADDTDTRVKTATDALRGELSERLAGIDGQVSRAVADSLPSISESVLAATRAELDTRLGVLREESQALLDERVGALDAELRGAIDARAQELRSFATEAATAQLDALLPSRLQPLQSRLDGLDTRIGDVEGRQRIQETGATSLAAKLQEVARTQDDGLRGLRAELDARLAEERTLVDSRFADLEGSFDGRVRGALDQALGPAVDERVKVAFDRALPELDGRMRSIAADAAGEVEARLNERTEGLVREQTEAARRQLSAELDAKLSDGLERMPRRVFSEMRPDLIRLTDERIGGR